MILPNRFSKALFAVQRDINLIPNQTGKEVQQEKAPPLGRPSASRLRLYPRSDEPRASQSRDRSARWRRTDWNMGYELKGSEAELAYMASPDHWGLGSLGYATEA